MHTIDIPKMTHTKADTIQKYSLHEKDTGSPEVQIALLSVRINDLTKHLQEHKKDKHSRYGLLTLVNQRRKLIKYLKQKSQVRYELLIKSLGLRR